MRKQILDQREEFNSILPEYGRRKLLTYADSIRELAGSFKETESNQEILLKRNRRIVKITYGRSALWRTKN